VQSFQRIHSSRSAVLSTVRLLVPFRENFTSYRTQLRGRIWAYIISRQIRRAIGIKPERRFNLGLPFGAVGRTNTGLRGSGKSVEVEAEHRHQQLPPWSQTATWEGYSFSHEALQHTSTKMRPYQYTSPPTTSTNSGFEYSPYGTGTPLPQPQRERGARRKKIAAVAGSVYRAGVAAASELKEQYYNSRAAAAAARDIGVTKRGIPSSHVSGPGAAAGADESPIPSIPNSFPHVKIATSGKRGGGEEQHLILFPTYTKRFNKSTASNLSTRFPPGHPFHQALAAAIQTGAERLPPQEEEYWRSTVVMEENAVVDVDVRGWVYRPHRGPLTRKNRMVIGLARKMSGVSSAQPQAGGKGEEGEIVRELGEYGSDGEGERPPLPPRTTGTGLSTAATVTIGPPVELTEEEQAAANATLMARIGPFLTTAVAQAPVTLFFYNDTRSRSHTILTDSSGHFCTRVALSFTPTHIRVLANEDLSMVSPIEVTPPQGISLISDIDDTIKHSGIYLGAREIFRNVFVRSLENQTVDGVREWFNRMEALGVKMHYCSNSPWQLYPMLGCFFHVAGLPMGSMHLKQYSGMLQGLFEPVAERKKANLEGILRDFPERKFLLVGDSGEADLEVYTELAVQNPGRVLAVFVRDVTTPEQTTGFFDSSFGAGNGAGGTRQAETARNGARSNRPPLPPRTLAPPPSLGSLGLPSTESPTDGTRDIPRKPVPPPRPSKPAALRGAPSDNRPRTAGADVTRPSPQLSTESVRPSTSARPTPPPPPPPRRRTTPLAVTAAGPVISVESSREPDPPRLPPRSSTRPLGQEPHPVSGISRTATTPPVITSEPTTSAGTSGQFVNKKVETWLRKLARAHEVLDAVGVKLYTWRKGDDVVLEAEGIVREALKALNRGEVE